MACSDTGFFVGDFIGSSLGLALMIRTEKFISSNYLKLFYVLVKNGGYPSPKFLIVLLLPVFIGVCFLTPTVQAQGGSVASGSGETERPKWKLLRFEEDWSILKNSPKSKRTHLFDPIKYIPLSADGKLWVSFGGHARARLENWSDFSFNSANTDSFLVTRVILHSDIHYGEHFRLFAEGKSAHVTSRNLPGNSRTLDMDEFELQQAFVDFRFPLGDMGTITLRPGRRELSKGKQRLVSPLPWANAFRHWDGVSAILETHGWNVEGFWTHFTPVEKYGFNDPDSGNLFSGIYGTGKTWGGVGMDLYWLLKDHDGRTFNGTTGDEERHTLGGRVWGKVPQFHIDYDLEGAYQFGELSTADIDAFMIATQVGYKRGDWFWQPRVFLGFDYASGDDQAGGDVGTFNQLFPLGHAYLGFMDFVGRQNSVDFSHGVTLKPIKKLAVTLTGHNFWRADTNDALYSAGAAVERAGSAGTSDDIGYEVDLIAKYKFNRHLAGLFGYSHFYAGDFIGQSGTKEDMDFIYLQGIFTF